VENVCAVALSYARSRGAVGAGKRLDPAHSLLKLTVRGDNQFYSQAARLDRDAQPRTRAALASVPRFAPFLDPGNQAKTGLGSSAALVVAVCGAVLHALGVVVLPSRRRCDAADSSATAPESDEALRVVHAVSQLAHCAAQGKVGSGFDVCSAAYGTQEYVRFSPAVIGEALDALVAGGASACAAVAACVDGADAWDHRALPFALPPSFRLVVGDVASGASTPSMVRALLAWRAEQQEGESGELWPRLERCHASAAAAVRALAAAAADAPAAFEAAVRVPGFRAAPAAAPAAGAESGGTSDDTAVAPEVAAALALLRAARGAYADLRATVRTVSDLSAVPVEPRRLTPLLDATEAVDGVLFAGCPGAGGEDAIFALVADPAAVAKVEALWEGWTDGVRVCALDVRDGDGGVAIEN
jgi:phosphomevalonate kinase